MVRIFVKIIKFNENRFFQVLEIFFLNLEKKNFSKFISVKKCYDIRENHKILKI